MKNMFDLLEQYEVSQYHEVEKEVVGGVAFRIFVELLDEGYMAEDLANLEETMDILLVDIGYEFADEDTLVALAEDLQIIAIADIFFSEEEEEEEEEAIPEFQYTVIKDSIDLVKGTKDTYLVQALFDDLRDIDEYVYEMGVRAEGDEIKTFAEMMDVEEAYDLLIKTGYAECEVLAEQIPDSAIAVLFIMYFNEGGMKLQKADMYAVYEVTNVNTEI